MDITNDIQSLDFVLESNQTSGNLTKMHLKMEIVNVKFLNKLKEHIVDTQVFLLCHITPSRLSFWEEVKAKMKINDWVALGKMKPSTSKYAYKMTLLVKKDESC
jgi:hypothetical protein